MSFKDVISMQKKDHNLWIRFFTVRRVHLVATWQIHVEQTRETNDNNNIYHRDKMPCKKYREQESDGRQAGALSQRPTSKRSILSMFVIIEAAI